MKTTHSNRTVENALAAERKSGGSQAEFRLRNLSVLAYAQGFTLWHYKATALRVADTARPNFFSEAHDLFAIGDMVLISAADGGAVRFVSAASLGGGVATTGLTAP